MVSRTAESLRQTAVPPPPEALAVSLGVSQLGIPGGWLQAGVTWEVFQRSHEVPQPELWMVAAGVYVTGLTAGILFDIDTLRRTGSCASPWSTYLYGRWHNPYWSSVLGTAINMVTRFGTNPVDAVSLIDPNLFLANAIAGTVTSTIAEAAGNVLIRTGRVNDAVRTVDNLLEVVGIKPLVRLLEGPQHLPDYADSPPRSTRADEAWLLYAYSA